MTLNELKKHEDFIKSYNDDRNGGYLLEIDVQYLHNLHKNLSFLPERMNIEKFEKLVANLHDKTEYLIHIRNFKKASKHRLVLKTHMESLKDLVKIIY